MGVDSHGANGRGTNNRDAGKRNRRTPANATPNSKQSSSRAVKNTARGAAVGVRRGTQKRIEISFYVVGGVLAIMAARFIQLQAIASHQRGPNAAADAFTRREPLLPRRGDILAADGTAVALTLDEYAVCANPRAVSDKPKMARVIAEAIGGSESEYLSLLQKTTHANGEPNYYVRLATRVDEDRVKKLKARIQPSDDEHRSVRAQKRKFFEAISLEPTPRRVYPLGSFASQLVGFTTNDGKGADGLEWAWDKELGGVPGERISQVDARKRPLPGFVKDWRQPVPGKTLVTTIDPEIQAGADEVLMETWQKFKPNFLSAIVMRPRTGEIVAMSTAPGFDPNKKPTNIAELATNRGLQFVYEPGSTFKLITAAAAIETVPNWQSYSHVCNGIAPVGGRPMRCWVNSTAQRRHGDEDLSEGIRDSCNFSMYGFARLMGAKTLREYSKKFGLGEEVELANLRENVGYVARHPEDWGQRQLASFSFGQSMLLTPMQLIRASAAIANDGVMMKPMLIKEVRDEEGRIIKHYEPEVMRKVIEPETAREVEKMMQRVTREGTARKFVFVPGYATSGKTGSAQKAIGSKGYAAGKFISSFVGFVPSPRAEFVILVLADEPHGSHWGSEVCGPAFSGIAKKAMLSLRLKEGAAAPPPSPALMTQPKEKS
jgi:cell division protein FtsI/penicillin-binding protein 2